MPENPFLEIDRKMLGDIHTSSEPMDNLTVLCDDFGSRFGGTAGERQAADFFRDKFKEFGLKRPRVLGLSFDQLMRLQVRSALRQMTDVEKVMRIESIIPTKRSGGRAGVVVAFTDLTQPNVPGLSPQIVSFTL